jgi:hypothetical protein
MKKNTFAKVVFVVFLISASCTAKSMPKTEIMEEVKPNYKEQFEAAYAQLQIMPPSQRKELKPLVLAHYMPWFQKYGFHWQQGGASFDPEQILPDGRANIASHYYPLTGNYDSADPLVLDYQLALMKIAGIDGVIFDWYGITEGIDYKAVHEATMAMIERIKKRGGGGELKYAICYEDQSIKHLIDFGIVPRDKAISTAKGTFEWMEKNWFSNAEYVKINGRPLVLCFGPQFFFQKTEWDEIWAGLKNRPFFIDLDGRSNWADGTKNWSPMYLSLAGKLAITDLVKYLNDFYRKQEDKPFVVGTAFPAFHDIYAQAGGKSYGYLDYSDGETFKLTWVAAEQAHSNIIQIQTWNDYGEGTIVEPTIERGYADLEFIQDKRAELEPDFPFGYNDLRIPIELYKILVNKNVTNEQKKQVAAIYDLLFAGDAQAFRQAVRTAGIKFDFSVSPLLMNASDSGQKIQAFDPAGRKNLAFGKPAVASSKIDVYTANKAVDGDVSSYWEGAARSFPGTLHVDLINPEKITTIVVKLNPQKMWGKRTQRIEIKTGNDGEKWTVTVPEKDYIFDPETNANTAVIPVNVTTRYVQLVFTANTGATNGQMAELEIYGE